MDCKELKRAISCCTAYIDALQLLWLSRSRGYRLGISLVSQSLPPAPPQPAEELNAVCPTCGGPALEELFWSCGTESEVPVLKRQLLCGGRVKRYSKVQHCEATVEVVQDAPARAPSSSSEPSDQPDVIRVSVAPSPAAPPPASEPPAPAEDGPGAETEADCPVACAGSEARREERTLSEVAPPAVAPVEPALLEVERTVNFLARLTEALVEDVLTLARLRREQGQRKRDLERRLFPGYSERGPLEGGSA